VILCGFAAIVGVLTTRRIQQDFRAQVEEAAVDLSQKIDLRYYVTRKGDPDIKYDGPSLTDYADPQNAAIRIVTLDGSLIRASKGAPNFGPPLAPTQERLGFRIESRGVRIQGIGGNVAVQYARRLSDVEETAARVRVFLVIGVLGGALLALLAGLATARRAMSPISQLTEAAREIGHTRDPSRRIPQPEADDEVAELARTLDEMLQSLATARVETETTLNRQREFVADASHELRTPLTSILANLELLEETLSGDHQESASAALRSARRMRRLVADLLLLARADAGREARHEPVDVSEVLTEAAAELEPVAGRHAVTVRAQPGAVVEGARDELHRLALNLLENAIRHTDPGTVVEATVDRDDGNVVLAVEDDGPGIPEELGEKVFERFYRASSDRGGSSGLGLSIVRAVADSHHGTVTLEPPLDGRGARFVVRLPIASENGRMSD
jgi:signal transduction histidine kinase